MATVTIEQKLTNMLDARNVIRTKLVELGLADSSAKLEALANAIDDIVNRGAISATVQEGTTYTIPAGYHNGSGTVSGISGGGNYNLQSKSSIIPTKKQQHITADEGYFGLSDVTIEAIPTNYQDVSSVDAKAAVRSFKSAGTDARLAKYNGSNYSWYLRTPAASSGTNNKYAFYVSSTGWDETGNVTNSLGIRPAMILDSTANVESDGTISVNTAPTTPGVPSVPSEISGGESTSVSWTASTDADSNLSGYELEVSLDGGSWTQIYKGSSRSYSYTVPEGVETIAFRVRAYDSLNAYSSYATTSTFTVINGKIKGTVFIGGVLRDISDSGVNIGGTIKSLKG